MRVFFRYSPLLTYLTQTPKRGVEKKSKKAVAEKKTLENGRRFRYNRRKIAPDSTARGTRHFITFSFHGAFYERLFRNRRRHVRR